MSATQVPTDFPPVGEGSSAFLRRWLEDMPEHKPGKKKGLKHGGRPRIMTVVQQAQRASNLCQCGLVQ